MSEETTIRIKIWAIITVAIGIFGFFFFTAMAHESRLTKVETTLDVNLYQINKTLDKMSGQLDRHTEGERR